MAINKNAKRNTIVDVPDKYQYPRYIMVYDIMSIYIVVFIPIPPLHLPNSTYLLTVSLFVTSKYKC